MKPYKNNSPIEQSNKCLISLMWESHNVPSIRHENNTSNLASFISNNIQYPCNQAEIKKLIRIFMIRNSLVFRHDSDQQALKEDIQQLSI